MKMYIHTWKDKQTGEICKIGEGRIATSLDEAVTSYCQEEYPNLFNYHQTIIVDISAGRSESINIEIEMHNRAVEALSPAEITAMKEFECGFNQSKYGEEF